MSKVIDWSDIGTKPRQVDWTDLQPATAAPQSDNRDWLEVADDQIMAYLKPLGLDHPVDTLNAIKKKMQSNERGTPTMLWNEIIKPALIQAKDAAVNLPSAIGTTVRGTGALAAPGSVNAPTREDWLKAATEGGNLLQAAPTIAGAASLVKEGTTAALSPFTEGMRDIQSRSITTALSPKSTDLKLAATKIAPELAKRRGLWGLTGNRFDQAVLSEAEKDGIAVGAAEDLIPHDAELTGAGPRMLAKVDSAIERLKGLRGNESAIKQLQGVRDDIAALGDNPNAKSAIDLRRKMDKFVEDAGGFKQVAIAQDRNNLLAHRAGGNILRSELNTTDPRLAKANNDFSTSRRAADIIEDRVAKNIGKALVPSAPQALLDLGGYYVGGPAGAATAQGIGMLAGSRGAASVVGAASGKLAGLLETPTTTPIEISGFAGPKASELPRDASGQILPGNTFDKSGPLLPGTTVRNPAFTPGENRVVDTANRDILGQILPGDTLDTGRPLLPGTTVRNPSFTLGENRVVSTSPRDPITGEILMTPSEIHRTPVLDKGGTRQIYVTSPGRATAHYGDNPVVSITGAQQDLLPFLKGPSAQPFELQPLGSVHMPSSDIIDTIGKALQDDGLIGTRGASLLAKYSADIQKMPPTYRPTPQAVIDQIGKLLHDEGLIGTRGIDLLSKIRNTAAGGH